MQRPSPPVDHDPQQADREDHAADRTQKSDRQADSLRPSPDDPQAHRHRTRGGPGDRPAPPRGKRPPQRRPPSPPYRRRPKPPGVSAGRRRCPSPRTNAGTALSIPDMWTTSGSSVKASESFRELTWHDDQAVPIGTMITTLSTSSRPRGRGPRRTLRAGAIAGRAAEVRTATTWAPAATSGELLGLGSFSLAKSFRARLRATMSLAVSWCLSLATVSLRGGQLQHQCLWLKFGTLPERKLLLLSAS